MAAEILVNKEKNRMGKNKVDHFSQLDGLRGIAYFVICFFNIIVGL